MVLPRLSARRRAVLEQVAGRVPYGDGVRVAVDGVDGAGKTVFADQLGQLLRSQGREVVRVSVDDFHHPARSGGAGGGTRRRASTSTASTWPRCVSGCWTRSVPAATGATALPPTTS